MYYIGIDSGSTNGKIVLFKDKIITYRIFKTVWNNQEVISKEIARLVNEYQIKEYKVIVTGYGRDAFNDDDYSLTEISCHALGGHYLNNSITGIIDIGGQDSKVIQLHNGKVINFLMNDKCAAGTGSFLSMTCTKLGISLNEIDDFIKDDNYTTINSMCAVFAESEIVGLLSKNIDRSHILLGVIQAIVQRIKQMVSKLAFNNDDIILLTGGLAQSKIFLKVLNEKLSYQIISDDKAIYAGAIGACLYGIRKEGDNNDIR
jgi:predicted CoA-substrate-specific enzyme activase